VVVTRASIRERTASTAVAPGGPAERHHVYSFMGASPQPPSLAPLDKCLEERRAATTGQMEHQWLWKNANGLIYSHPHQISHRNPPLLQPHDRSLSLGPH
jgi:hypothetical protein